jgi:MFS transporter, putative signal transducer
MEIVALYSLFMTVSSTEQPGTDFTTLSCAQLVVYLVGSLASGRIADTLGYPVLFGLATALSGLAVLATLMLLRRVPPGPPARQDVSKQKQTSAAALRREGAPRPR